MEKLLLGEMRRLDDPYRLWNQQEIACLTAAGAF
jgi:hypothetical protein